MSISPSRCHGLKNSRVCVSSGLILQIISFIIIIIILLPIHHIFLMTTIFLTAVLFIYIGNDNFLFHFTGKFALKIAYEMATSASARVISEGRTLHTKTCKFMCFFCEKWKFRNGVIEGEEEEMTKTAKRSRIVLKITWHCLQQTFFLSAYFSPPFLWILLLLGW